MDKKILVVDDESHIRQLVKDNLEEENYEVFTANDGLAAMSMIDENDPDLIILDVMMPDMDGWEVCKAVRDRDEKTKIIMLTARSTSRDRMIGKRILKADKYLTKPFDIEELLLQTRRLLEL
ncbi:MAG: response regulator transcription factor [Candidatus Brocadiia bacterium]